MGNLNDNTLPIVKGALGISGSTEDSAILVFIKTGIPIVDLTLKLGMSVTVTDSSYVLDPDPDATDGLWAVLALEAVYLYKADALRDELLELNGLTTISDQVQSFSRAENIRALREDVEKARQEAQSAINKYSRGSSLTTAYSYQEIEPRDDTIETVLGIDV